MKKNKKIFKHVIFGAIIFSLMPFFAHAASPFDYHLLEAFPGFYSAGASVNDLPAFILAIYKFGIWTVGIAGLLMLTIGGFMYMSSAGNTSIASNAKGIIDDAIIGIIAALCAYLILYVINPDLTKIEIKFTPSTVTNSPAATNNGGYIGEGKVIAAAVAMMNNGCLYSQPLRNSCAGNPGYTDCSNFVCTSFRNAGCSCPGNVSGDYGSKSSAIDDKNSLKAGDILWVSGHVVMCTSDGCNQVIGAAGVGKNIKYSNGSYYIDRGARVVRASDYCE